MLFNVGSLGARIARKAVQYFLDRPSVGTRDASVKVANPNSRSAQTAGSAPFFQLSNL